VLCIFYRLFEHCLMPHRNIGDINTCNLVGCILRITEYIAMCERRYCMQQWVCNVNKWTPCYWNRPQLINIVWEVITSWNTVCLLSWLVIVRQHKVCARRFICYFFWPEFRNAVAVETGLLNSKPLTNSRSHFLINLVNSEAAKGRSSFSQ